MTDFAMRHFVRTAALLLVAGCVLAAPAQAAPPTATPSPGYDRRLDESRRPAAAPEWRKQTPARRALKHKRRH